MEEIINLDSDNESKSETIKVQDKVIISNLYSITIKKSDYDRLDPGTYLNDNLIDFFLGHLIQGKKEFFAFNSFFYPALKETSFERVHKWFKSINLFKFRYWIIPVARNEHWVLIIVTNPKNVASGKRPSTKILFFDSLDTRFFDPQRDIEDFIRLEWREKFKTDITPNVPIFFLNLPLQNNSFDCGVFLLKYAQKFVKNPRLFDDLEQPFQDLFKPEKLKHQRAYMKSTIYDISDGKKCDWIRKKKCRVYLQLNDDIRRAMDED
jgi:Ulp1 family protease